MALGEKVGKPTTKSPQKDEKRPLLFDAFRYIEGGEETEKRHAAITARNA